MKRALYVLFACLAVTALFAAPSEAFNGGCEGYAARFDGTNWLDAGTGLWAQPQTYTLEFWIKPGMVQSRTRGVIGNFLTLERHGFGLGFMMDGDRIVFVDGTYDGGLSASLQFDQWTHVAGTHGPAGSALYIDGEVVSQRPGQAEMRYHPSANFLIGLTPGEQNGFAGEIAEVRLWNTQRTESEIAQNWDKPISTADGKREGLTAYWAMRGSGEFFVVDETDNAHAAFAGAGRLPLLSRACVTDCNSEDRCVPAGYSSKLLKRQTTALPDITVDAARAQSTMYLEQRTFLSTDCAVNEGCASPGTRILLRFDTAVPNIGTADLNLGNPAASGAFYYDPCHRHYHFSGFASYRLYSNNRTLTRLGRKQAFCLEDFEPVAGYTGQRSLLPKHDCNNQGVSVGWQDVYVAGLDCQWIDITGITVGSYWLYVEINPVINGQRAFTESDYTNNVFWIPFRIANP